MATEGKKAPAFTLEDKDGEKYKLGSFQEDYLVLFFYPKDSTPGCTTETVGFDKLLRKFANQGAAVVGISGGTNKTKQKFCEKHSLKTLLLTDPDYSTAKKYGAFGLKKFMGREYEGIFRMTFVLDKNRKVIKVFEKVKPAEHPQEVLDFIKDQA